MEQNVCEKYAVYTTTNGNDTLTVVVDTLPLAQTEMNNLKNGGNIDELKVKKVKIENFKQAGEREVGSEVVDSWKKNNPNGESFSAKAKEGGGLPPTENNGTQNNTNNVQPTPAVIDPKQKLEEFYNFYTNEGAIMYGQYYLPAMVSAVGHTEPVEVSAKANEKKKEGGEINENEKEFFALLDREKEIFSQMGKSEFPSEFFEKNPELKTEYDKIVIRKKELMDSYKKNKK